jgi:hypothetical protein
MRIEFANYLVDQGCVDSASANEAAAAAQSFREIIGALALRYELMSPEQVEAVLAELSPGQKFGELAVERNFLTRHQVDSLLQIQCLEEIVEIGGNLLLQGNLSAEEFLSRTSEFLNSVARPLLTSGKESGNSFES